MSKVEGRSKWPEEYRLTYKLPHQYSWSEKYCQATTDKQAVHSFCDIFTHLREKLDKSDIPSNRPVFDKIEKKNRFTDSWEEIDFNQHLE